MRDRLIEMLKEAETKVTEIISPPLALEEWLGVYADYLLANGVIVPPCKVGDTVYELENFVSEKCKNCLHFRDYGDGWCRKSEDDIKPKECMVIEEKVATENDILHWLYFERYNKTIFLTREEAEQALKGGLNNGKEM